MVLLSSELPFEFNGLIIQSWNTILMGCYANLPNANSSNVTSLKSQKLIGVLPLYRAIPLYRAWSFDESLCVYCGALQWLYGIENIALDRASKRHKLGWLLYHEGFTCDVIVAIMAKSPVRYLAVSLGIKAYRYISRWLLRWSSFLVELERVWEFWASSCTGFFKLRFL